MKTKHTKAAKKVKKLAQPKQAPARSKAARTGIAEGTRLYALAGRPTKADFIKVYGRTDDDLGAASQGGC
jgi:hypothetical protein